jgi:uncharacterized protein YvpB
MTSLRIISRLFRNRTPATSRRHFDRNTLTLETLENRALMAVNVVTNTAPTGVSLSHAVIPENRGSGAVIGTLTTTDRDPGNTFTYSLVSGSSSTDNAAFTIVGNKLQTAQNFDFEAKNRYIIRVRSTDQGGLSRDRAFSIGITNVNEAPTDLTLSAMSIATKSPKGFLVGLLRTTDDYNSKAPTYRLVRGLGSDDNAAFAIRGSQLVTAQSLNSVSRSHYSIRIRTTDAGGLSYEKALTVTADRQPARVPTDILLSAASVRENNTPWTLIGDLRTNRDTPTRPLTYSLVEGVGSTDSVAFRIRGSHLYATTSFNYEEKSSYSVRVRVTNAGTLITEKQFTIAVTDANESPLSVTLSATSVAGASPAGTMVGSLSTADPDSGNTFTYTLVSGTGDTDNAAFTISGTQLKTTASFSTLSKPSCFIRVRSTDQGGLATERALEVVVSQSANDYGMDALVAGVRSLFNGGNPGPVRDTCGAWVPLVSGDSDSTSPSAFASARHYGAGRVAAFGHDGMPSHINHLDNATFLMNVTRWLNARGSKQVLYTTGHSEWATASGLSGLAGRMSKEGYTFNALPGAVTSEKLETAGVLIIGNGWKAFSDVEIQAIERFTAAGGGVWLLGLGWSWTQYHPSSTIEDYPMTKVAAPFGIRWLTNIISDPTNNINGSPIFTTFYPSASTSLTPPNQIGVVSSTQVARPTNVIGRSGYIPLIHQRQEPNLCVPTSASMVLRYYGSSASPREIKTLSRGLPFDPSKPFNDYTMTYFKDLIQGVGRLGYTWQLRGYANTDAGVASGLSDIRQAIDRGNPVLIDTTLYGGHTFAVTGYDESNQTLYGIDPNISSDLMRVLRYSDVAKIWNSSGAGSSSRWAVFTEGRR